MFSAPHFSTLSQIINKKNEMLVKKSGSVRGEGTVKARGEMLKFAIK